MAYRRLAGLGHRRLAVGTIAGVSGAVKSLLQFGSRHRAWVVPQVGYAARAVEMDAVHARNSLQSGFQTRELRSVVTVPERHLEDGG